MQFSTPEKAMPGSHFTSPINLTSSFLDLAQMEVLRGPQGTVNGQNADGGAINATTQLATLDGLHGEGEASYGSYEYNRCAARRTSRSPIRWSCASRSSTKGMRAGFASIGHGKIQTVSITVFSTTAGICPLQKFTR